MNPSSFNFLFDALASLLIFWLVDVISDESAVLSLWNHSGVLAVTILPFLLLHLVHNIAAEEIHGTSWTPLLG